MKKLIATLLLLAVSSSFALAQPTIGIYEDPDYTFCYGDFSQYVGKDVYMAAWLPPEIPAITACEFSVAGLPGPADAIVSPTWTTTLVIGTIGFDISLAWNSAQPGPWVLLGTVNFFYLIAPPADQLLTVVNGQTCDCLVVVDDQFNTIDAGGGMYTINCSVPAECLCFNITPTENTSWGSLKSLY